MSPLKEFLLHRNQEEFPIDPDKYIEKASKLFAEDVVNRFKGLNDVQGIYEIDKGIEDMGLLPYDTRAWYIDLRVARAA